MKYTLRLAALLLAALLLVGCQAASPSPAATPAPTEAPAAADEDATTAATEGSLDALLLEPGKLVVGTSPDYPPYEFLEGDKLVGFDVELMEAVGQIMDLEIVWSRMEFDPIVVSLMGGQIDAGISGFTYTEDRAAGGVLFSTPYLDSAQIAFVLEDSDIYSTDDFAGKIMYSSLGTTGEMALQDLEIEDMEIMAGTDFQLAFQLLSEGQIDGVVCDAAVGQRHIDSGKPFRAVEPALLEEQNHIVFATGSEALMEQVNKAVEQYMQTDEYVALREKFGF